MSKTKVVQNSLVSGVLSPTLIARTDIAKYQNGMLTGDNVTLMPHGGVKRRPGLEQIAEYSTTNMRLFAFEFSSSVYSLIVFSTTDIKIYTDDILVDTIVASFTVAQLEEMDIIQSGDTTIVTHGDFTPFKILREAPTTWTKSDVVFDQIPQFNFNQIVETYENRGTTNEVNLKIGDIVYNNDGDDDRGLNNRFYRSLQNRNVIDLSEDFFTGITPDFINNGATTTGRTIEKGTVIYNDDGNDTDGLNERFYKAVWTRQYAIDLAIEDYTDESNWTVMSEGTLYEDLGEGKEDVWSATRGYPRTLAFHQGRLWFGGTPSQINTLWGSVSNNYFNFDTGTGEVDDAIFDTLNTDQWNEIVNITSANNFVVITKGGEFINIASIITPETSGYKRQTTYGGKRLPVISLDGTVYFVDKFGKSLRYFTYNYEEDTYLSPSASLLAEHIIEDVKDLDIMRGKTGDASNIMFLINNSGTAAVYNTMRTEDIAGWTRYDLNGKFDFKKVAVVGEETYFLIARDDDTSFIGKLQVDHYLDQTFTATSDTKVEVNEYAYNNQDNFRIIADGALQQNTTVVSEAGSYYIYADRSFDSAYAGYIYNVEVETMPLSAGTQDKGQISDIVRSVAIARLNLFKTRGIEVNGVTVPFRQFGDPLNQTPPEFTGIKKISLSGYNDQKTISITQESPDPFTLLGISSEVTY